MNFVIDLSSVGSSSGIVNPMTAMWFLLTHGGWYLFIPIFIWGGWEMWLNYIREKFSQSVKYALLAIDVPKENEQSPKAVEQVFAHISGIQKRGNLKERYLHGYAQLSISLELVSIEGYVQFLIRTPEKFRDLVEAAFYAQYPNAEITEVEDYSQHFKPQFPNEEYDLWGAELKLTNKECYPIKTYPLFEHTLSQTFFDPMANILETFSRLGRGEQVWLQMVIEPAPDDEWRETGIRIIKKLVGIKSKSKGGGISDLLWLPLNVAHGLYDSAVASIVAPTGFGESGSTSDNAPPSLMQHLPPNERLVVEQVGMKISKIGYVSKLRLVYIGKHDVFNKDRVSAFMGSLKQYNTLDLNGFMVDKKTKTAVDYFFVQRRNNWRKWRILWGYKYRSMKRGRNHFVLNVEELASLYHFPVTTVVKAPRVQKTESKRGEPPTALPVESTFQRTKPFIPGQTAVAMPEEDSEVQVPAAEVIPDIDTSLPSVTPQLPPTVKGQPPSNLPV